MRLRIAHEAQSSYPISAGVTIQRSPLFCAPGLVKFVAAVARLFRLALPGSFLNVFGQNKGDLCRC